MIKPLAIYLPQYHTIPENDKAWGNGFTEWTNVKKAKPLFYGHNQPHVPHESVGYYDLRNPETLIKQVELAKKYGIYGFAFYHYWFNGKRLLNLPIDNMLKSEKTDFPFCLIWANENWTKRWDGLNNEIIIKQDYSFEDDLDHIRFLCKNVFSNKRYIKINNKPVFIVYRTELFPDIKKTANIWRNEVKKYGFEGIYLIRVESFSTNIRPKTINFDAAMEFAPKWSACNKSIEKKDCKLIDYPTTVFNMLLNTYDYKIFRTVFPSWDNTARRGKNGTIFINNNLDVFKYYLQRIIEFCIANNKTEENFLFINAWNEWGEGCHIEPDNKLGYKYLEIIKETLSIKTENENYLKIIDTHNYFYKKISKIKKSYSYKIINMVTQIFSKTKKY